MTALNARHIPSPNNVALSNVGIGCLKGKLYRFCASGCKSLPLIYRVRSLIGIVNSFIFIVLLRIRLGNSVCHIKITTEYEIIIGIKYLASHTILIGLRENSVLKIIVFGVIV